MRFYSEVNKTRLFLSNNPMLVGYHGFGQTTTVQATDRPRGDEVDLQEVYSPELDESVKTNLNNEIHTFLERGLTLALWVTFT